MTRVMVDGALQCRACQRWALPEAFKRAANRPYGCTTLCKKCHNEQRVPNRKAERDKRAAKRRAEGKRLLRMYFGPPKPKHMRCKPQQPLRVIQGKKFCPGCGVWRSEYGFHRSAQTVSGLARDCDDCRADVLRSQRAVAAAYAERNKERIRQLERERYIAKKEQMTPEQCEAARAYAREWHQKHGKTPEARERRSAWRHEWEKTPAGRALKREARKTPAGRAQQKRSRQRAIDRLRDRYLRKLLMKQGMPVTPELIELKRLQVVIERFERSVRDEIAERLAGRDEHTIRRGAQRPNGAEDRE